MATEKSGIEKFFDLGRTEDMLAQEDPLSWENISNRQVGVDGNELIDRKPGDAGGFADSVGVTSGSMSTGRIDCLKAADCGSGYVCVNGECVLNNTAGQANNSGGVTTTECAVDPLPPPSGPDTSGCYGGGPACIDFTGPGDCNFELPEFELDCCGKTKYRCCNNGNCWDQCFKCFDFDLPDPPPIPDRTTRTSLRSHLCLLVLNRRTRGNHLEVVGCSDYIGANDSNFGGGGGCGSDCAECVNGKCQEKTGSFAPCFCNPGSCGECEQCKDSGSCGEPPPGQCRTYCNCRVWCPECKKYINGNFSSPVPATERLAGLSAACRVNLAKQCPTECDPPKDPCKDDPNNPCDSNCRCLSREKPCGGPTPCNPGKFCTSFGGGQVGEKCFEIVRECDPPPDDCDDKNCNKTGCGECEECVVLTGKCQRDEKCDDPPCEGRSATTEPAVRPAPASRPTSTPARIPVTVQPAPSACQQARARA